MKSDRIKLFLVDDNAVFLKTLEMEFKMHANFEIYTFQTGELCIKNLSVKPDVVILDYYLENIEDNTLNGIETLDKIKQYSADIPVIMLSSEDKKDVAINCLHHRAFDYVVKSESAFVRLQKIITSIFIFKKMEKQLEWYKKRR